MSTSFPNPDDSPIFIIGWGRSGTSLLRSMLNAHPRIHLTQEANFYVWTATRPHWTSARARLESYLRSFSFAWLQIDPQSIRDRLGDELTTARLADVHTFLMRTVAERYGRPRHGDKTPSNTDHLERIFSDYRAPRVIRMMRDPRAVAVSHTRMPFSSPSFTLLSHMMSKTPEAVRPFEDRLHTIRLEDLVADPRTTMEGVLEFVGEPWDDAVLDHPAHIPEGEGIPFPWLEPGGARPERRPPSWPTALSPAWIRIIEHDNRETMERFHYASAELEHEPTAHERRMALLRDLGSALPFLWRATWTLLRLSVPPWIPPEENQRMLHNLNPRAWKAQPDWHLPSPPQRPR